MSGKRAIDRQRDSAITMHVGGDDPSAVMEFLSTGNALYAIKEKGVYKIQLADDIDPQRTNPSIPNLNQQILNVGYDNEIVGAILLTAKTLFDEKNATVKPFVASLFESCLTLTKQILELDEIVNVLADEITQKETAMAQKSMQPNAVIIPSVPGMDSKLHNIVSKADKAKNTLLAICRLQFTPDATGKIKLDELEQKIVEAMSAEPQLATAWNGIFDRFKLIRNLRNVSEHPKENYRIALTDFKMQPDGKVNPPLVEIQHPETPIDPASVVSFSRFVRDMMLDNAETILVLIRLAGLLNHNPFGEWVSDFPEEERRHKHVQFYRALNIGGRWRILG